MLKKKLFRENYFPFFYTKLGKELKPKINAKVSWHQIQCAGSISACILKQTVFCSPLCFHLKCDVTVVNEHNLDTSAAFFSPKSTNPASYTNHYHSSLGILHHAAKAPRSPTADLQDAIISSEHRLRFHECSFSRV